MNKQVNRVDSKKRFKRKVNQSSSHQNSTKPKINSRQHTKLNYDSSRNNGTRKIQEKGNKFEYYSLLSNKNSQSKKKLGIQTNNLRSKNDSQSVRIQNFSRVKKDEEGKELNKDKYKEDINALENLNYMNACARMDLISANNKLMNINLLKKCMDLNKAAKNNNKSMDFTLTFKSDFSV